MHALLATCQAHTIVSVRTHGGHFRRNEQNPRPAQGDLSVKGRSASILFSEELPTLLHQRCYGGQALHRLPLTRDRDEAEGGCSAACSERQLMINESAARCSPSHFGQ